MMDALREPDSDILRCVRQFCDSQLEARHIVGLWRDGALI